MLAPVRLRSLEMYYLISCFTELDKTIVNRWESANVQLHAQPFECRVLFELLLYITCRREGNLVDLSDNLAEPLYALADFG